MLLNTVIYAAFGPSAQSVDLASFERAGGSSVSSPTVAHSRRCWDFGGSPTSPSRRTARECSVPEYVSFTVGAISSGKILVMHVV